MASPGLPRRQSIDLSAVAAGVRRAVSSPAREHPEGWLLRLTLLLTTTLVATGLATIALLLLGQPAVAPRQSSTWWIWLPLVLGLGSLAAIVFWVTTRSAARQAHDALAAQALQLRRSNEDLKQFAYVVSHDLKEPLRMVAGYVQLLADECAGRVSPDADQFIEHAVEGATRMQRMIDDVLDYARLGQQGTRCEPVDLRQVVTTVRHNLAVAIQEATATIEVGPLPELQAAPAMIERLLQNLVANALKFRGEAAPHVRISGSRRGGQVVIEVADNGIGIAAADVERIFGIFSRLHGGSRYEGTGIGLAVCQKIVQCHSGRIEVESQPGRGTTFRCLFPERPRGGGEPRVALGDQVSSAAPPPDGSAIALRG